MGTSRLSTASLMVWLTALLCSDIAWPATATLVHDSTNPASLADCDGVAAALEEVRVARRRVDLATTALSDLEFDTPVLVACHLDLEEGDEGGAERLADWVEQGGSLLATGRSAQGLLPVLGLHSTSLVTGEAFTDVRFESDHALTHGIGWTGPIVSSPPLPTSQLPAIVRHFYDIDEPDIDRWPSYVPSPAGAEVIGYWRNMTDPWTAADTAAALTVHAHGQGRAFYSGALPGVYDDWDWPRSWRTVVVNAVEWLAQGEPVVELGLWPHGHTGAFTWTGDTEKAAMTTAVPALLAVFDKLGLERFGTFYIVGKQGGDADTEGAREHPDIVEAILSAGAEVGGHGDIHTAFINDDEVTQRQRLGDMLDIINPMLAPGELRGFRAPYLSQNRITWDVLQELGIDHDAGDADVWSHVTLPYGLGDLVQLPPSMPMDWHLFEEYDLSDDVVGTIWQDKLDYVLARRGLFSLLNHPWVIESHLEVVESLLSGAIERGDVWMARQDDVAGWWRQRRQLEIGPVVTSTGRLSVTAGNSGSRPIEGVSIWIRVPVGDDNSWTARLDGARTPLLEREHGQALFRVAVIERLEAGESVQLEVVREDRLFRDRFGS